jgi:hypothetical protein
MDKLRALTKHLIDHNLVATEQLDSWAEQVTLSLYWKLDEKGLYLGDMRYRAEIVLERFGNHPGRLMAHLGTWLVENDPDRHRDELPAPMFDIDQLDPDLADVGISLDFIEPLHLVEDADGEFEAFGTTWAFVPFDLWIAEQGKVTHGT